MNFQLTTAYPGDPDESATHDLPGTRNELSMLATTLDTMAVGETLTIRRTS